MAFCHRILFVSCETTVHELKTTKVFLRQVWTAGIAQMTNGSPSKLRLLRLVERVLKIFNTHIKQKLWEWKYKGFQVPFCCMIRYWGALSALKGSQIAGQMPLKHTLSPLINEILLGSNLSSPTSTNYVSRLYLPDL